jgi:quinoprotein dehydrogenase-associated probable ABC transporter substrate-binding protein
VKFRTFLLIAGFSLCSSALPPSTEAPAADPVMFSGKTFDELTPAEKTAAKAAARHKKLDVLRACADPGNMPLSNIKGEGLENKIAEVVAKALNTQLVYFWRPSIERGLTRQTFDTDQCDVILDVPSDYESVLTTVPIYRTAYVFAYRNDSGISIRDLDDPKLKELRVGVFHHSGLRAVLAKHGVIGHNLSIHVISHDADLNPQLQPWRQVQEVVDGKLDIAGVWGPFAGYVKTVHGAPIVIQAVNLMEDEVPLEFDLAFGVRETDVVLKYMLDHALEDSKDEIKKILVEYGVPLVQCSRCVVSGDLPSHGSFLKRMQDQARKQFLEPLSKQRPQLDVAEATPDQIVTEERVEAWLHDGSKLSAELSNAVVASDRERVGRLLDKGADINQLDQQGFAPIHAAARARDSDMIELLLARGADVNARDADGWTPLMHAAFRNHVPSVNALAKGGAKLDLAAPGGFMPLSIAISEGKFFAVGALLEAGANVNIPAGADSLTPLMLIASQPLVERRAASLNQGMSSVDIGRLLIEGGAEVNAKSAKGVTPLMIAAAHDNPPLIGLLLQAGADTGARTPEGKTALDIAKDNLNQAATQQIELLSGGRKRQGASVGPPQTKGTEAAPGQ